MPDRPRSMKFRDETKAYISRQQQQQQQQKHQLPEKERMQCLNLSMHRP